MVTLLDLHARYRLAMTVRRQSVELAGSAVGAVAVDKLTSVNRPVRVDHLPLPMDSAWCPNACEAAAAVNVTKRRAYQTEGAPCSNCIETVMLVDRRLSPTVKDGV